MPDKLYWDKKEEKEIIMPSDYFECNRCLGKKFDYDINPSFLSGVSGKKYKQICLKCGEVFFSDRRYTKEAVSRYVLMSEKLQKEAEAEKAKKLKEATRELEKDRNEFIKKQNADKK